MPERQLSTDGGARDAEPGPAASTRRLLDAVDQPIALLDLDGHVLHLNQAAVRLLELDPRQLRGQPFAQLSDAPEATADLVRLWAGSTGRRPGSMTLAEGPRASTRLRCDGARLDAATLVVRFRGEGDPDPLAQLSRDVETTSLRELQARLHTALAELEEANRQLATRNGELERYASAVAHDLRSPLYIMRGYVELLGAGHVGQVDDEAKRMLREVLQGADRMTAVIDGLLQIARLQVTAPEEPADGAAALQDAVADLRGEIAETGARLEVGQLPSAWADAPHLVQVFANLVGNSLKFHRPGHPPTVWIGGRRRADATEFVVEDDGPGVPERDRERIFELFDRGADAPERPGTGIGLATCRKVVESYGGEIRCEASDHGGARFVFTIADHTPPVADAAGAPPRS